MDLDGRVIGSDQPLGGIGAEGRSGALAEGDHLGEAAYDLPDRRDRVGIYSPIGTETMAAVEASHARQGDDRYRTYVCCAPGAHPRPKPREAVRVRITDGGEGPAAPVDGEDRDQGQSRRVPTLIFPSPEPSLRLPASSALPALFSMLPIR